MRRDLTINAIAKNNIGTIIDPYNGQKDLDNRILRHVSDAFSEDPLRVLRVARFAAKLAYLGFKIEPKTIKIMTQISSSGELKQLTPERIWQEWHKSLKTNNPDVFLSVLYQCGALKEIIPELHSAFEFSKKQNSKIFPLIIAKQIALLSTSLSVRFAAQIQYLDNQINFKNHVRKQIIKKILNRIKAPNKFKELAVLVCEEYQYICQGNTLYASKILEILDRANVWRKPKRLQQLITCCQAIQQTAGMELQIKTHSYPQGEFFLSAYQAALSVNISTIIQNNMQGKEIKMKIKKLRINAINKYIKTDI
ncbi:hypothetical protein O1U_0627 [Candidatus Photodesmus katoptron Akat1]|uniref:Uncharacterized protein n=2 Tax=Candidatus Photodesmus anomalopis TaxID=28176 RepID=S3DG10_9GAMM|nr:hypothetical protein O1U_0627 [Candidatus Photodesmus katoptron Akat1]